MTLTRIRPGDIVLVDGLAARGGEEAAATARYHATVLESRPAAGGGELVVRRLAGGRSFPVRAPLVIDHWRKAGRPRVAASRPEQEPALA